MTGTRARGPRLQVAQVALVRPGLLLPFLGLLLLVACGSQGQSTPSPQWPPPSRTPSPPTPSLPPVEISLAPADVSVKPVPLRAGTPFTVTLTIHNSVGVAVSDVPVLVHISPEQEAIGYSPFMEILTVTLPSTLPLTVDVPVHWNLAGGEHRLWVQVNHLPVAWQSGASVYPEGDTSDNSALLELMVQPFDAYESDLCSGRVDLEIDQAGTVAEPGSRRVRVRILNAGNQAAYNLPVVVSGQDLSGVAYTPAISPCGGTAEVSVQVDRPLAEAESILVRINPEGWQEGLAEDDFTNNELRTSVVAASGSAMPAAIAYDFAMASSDVESPEQWLLLVTVHNLGTRDAANVPIRIVNQAGRKVNDVIPLVQGNGSGVAAIRVGTLWKRGAVLVLTVNPTDSMGALPESDHSNNATTFVLP